MDAARLVTEALETVPVPAGQVSLLACGKAAAGMASAAVARLGPRIVNGLVVAPTVATLPAPLVSLAGNHPEPGEGSVEAGARALALAASVPADGVLLVLVSGGTSALLAAPVEGVTLAEKRVVTRHLLRGGATIHELNTVRKHLSRLKGGRLAAACRGRVITLALSDVVGDDLSVIGSGLTVGDPTTYADALAVIERVVSRAACPPAVLAHVDAGVRGDGSASPAPDTAALRHADARVIGTRHEAMAGARARAEALGYRVHVTAEPVVGDAAEAGARLGAMVRTAAPPGRVCLISSGETTVQVRGPGRGGRNQELALGAAQALHGWSRPCLGASVGTDGIDGPTDAAGGYVSPTTLVRLAVAGQPSVTAVLTANDAWHALAAIDDLVVLGPTGTNVGDLQIFLCH